MLEVSTRGALHLQTHYRKAELLPGQLSSEELN